ncbi:hypothetical protein Tco_0436657 [Tanacetum coccineum]
MYQPPLEPSRQKEFEHIVMNIILDQEERVKQLEEYMKVIIGNFMQLPSEVTRRLKDKIREEGGRLGKIEKITKYPDMEVPEPLAGHKFPKTPVKKMFHDTLKSIPTNPLWIRYVQLNFSNPPRFRKSTFGFKPGVTFTPGTSWTRISSPAKVLLKPSSSPLTKTLSLAPNGYDHNHVGVRFRLGGEQKEISFLELGWRIGLYSERQSRESATLSGLRKGFVCNIPYWLAKYMVGIREKSLICEGMFVTWIAQSYGLLNKEMMGALSVEPSPHVFKKKSLISMRVIMELHNGGCFWPTTLETVEEDEEDDKGDEAAGGDACHEGAGGSADMYCNMSQGDWQVRQAHWMDQQDEQWGRINT